MKNLEAKFTIKQVIEIPKHGIDHEIVILNLESPDLEITSDDIGSTNITSEVVSLDFTESNDTVRYLRALKVDVVFNEPEVAIKFLIDDGVCEEAFKEFSYLRFARFYIGGWEGIFIDDEMFDFDSELEDFSMSESL